MIRVVVVIVIVIVIVIAVEGAMVSGGWCGVGLRWIYASGRE